jgi:hypothetical protein
MRVHNESIETLSRYRRGGEQRVVIQHQQVNVSGQAKAMVGQFHAQGEGEIHKNKGGTPCQQCAEPKQEPMNTSHVDNRQWPMDDAGYMEEKAQVQKQKQDARRSKKPI